MKFNKEKGQVSRLLLVLAIVVLVAAVITYLILRMSQKPTPPPKPVGPALPVYEKQLGNIDFIFLSAMDRGETLKASDVTNAQYRTSWQKDLKVTPGGKFIQVTIGAKNMGPTNTETNAWDIENIVDSQARNYIPLKDYSVSPWLPVPDLCGAVLQPAFEPSSCSKIYEVSKEATGLQIRVETGKNNSANNLSSGKSDTFLIDLIVK